MKTYTEQEVIQMLVTERERAIKIADDYNNKYVNKANSYIPTDKDLIFVAKQEAEVCRKIANSIDGRFLIVNDVQSLEEQIKKEYLGNELTSMIVGEDMICPMTNKHCDDECCPVGAICNLANSHDIKKPDDFEYPNDIAYLCPSCKSNDIIDVDDHWSKCNDCDFSFVG